MKYEDARSKIRSGDLLAWSGNSWFSKLIKWWTKSKFSHVGIAWKANGRLFVIEAMDFKGVRIFPCSKLKPFYWIKTNVKWTFPLAEEAFKLVGDDYSKWGCVRAAFGLSPRKDDNWQCAEFSAHILRKAGFSIDGKLETPAKLVHEMVSKNLTLNYITK